jgi:hypothetical protein
VGIDRADGRAPARGSDSLIDRIPTTDEANTPIEIQSVSRPSATTPAFSATKGDHSAQPVTTPAPRHRDHVNGSSRILTS